MKSKGRYEILEILGEGGMGIVYRALDPVMNREVTVKTIKDPQDKAVLELFKRECAVLASMTHPNIVEIHDIGETDDGGVRRPYFVMPLLPGVTLQELIRGSSPRLTVERSIQMISQICRGLWAAHEQGLVHRDLKPSNLFVLPDDSVKIIDFGMAHLTNQNSAPGLKGTIPYMSPEQIQMKQQPTPLSDQFSLAVVCYEMLARRHPFTGAGHEDVVQAIMRYTPPPISEFNNLVSPAISQVVHKALAKDPYHRYSDVRKFSECLQKAMRGESIDIFDPARIAPRLQQARKAFDSGDLTDAAEIVMELESENYLTPEIGELRNQIEKSQREKSVKQLLETARRRIDEGEYPRALQKVQEVLNIDPANTDAFTLKGAIEGKRSTTQIEEWFRLANQHMENHAYTHARQALEKVLDLRPKEIRAQALLTEVERREQEHIRLRSEKEQVYKSALDAAQRGDISSAVSKMERVLDLDRRAPYSTAPDQGASYQRFYEEIRSKRDQLASQESEARRHFDEGNFTAAADVCDQALANYPHNIVLRALRDDIEQARRLEISAYVAKIERDVSSEPDLNMKVSILEEAQKKYPAEQRFEQSLQSVRTRRDTVDLIAGRARTFEEQRQFSDALGQWESLRNIYPKYPGLEIEIDRLHKRREQQARSDAKSQCVTQVDQALAVHNYTRAASLAADGLSEFPGDPELVALDKQVQQARNRAEEAEAKAHRGRELHESGDPVGALALLREAYALDAHNPMVRSGLIDTLLKEGGRHADSDWRTAEPFLQEALDLDPNNPLAKSIGTLIRDKRQTEDVSAALSKARELQTQGDLRGAFTELDAAREKYPREPRLIQFRASLREGLSIKDQEELRLLDLQHLNKLFKQSIETTDVQALESIFEMSHAFSKYGSDVDFRAPLLGIQERLRKEQHEQRLTKSLLAETVVIASPGSASLPPSGPPQTEANLVPTSYPAQRRPSWNGRMRTAAWVAAPMCVAVALLIGFSRRTKDTKPESKIDSPASKLAVLSIQGAQPGEYQVSDGNRNDVTGRSLTGLEAGNYILAASKPGFRPFELAFNLDPAREPKKTLAVRWEALPAEVRVMLSRSLGTVKVDGADQALDEMGVLKAQWNKGPHVVSWSTPGGESAEARFDFTDNGITVAEPVFHGLVVGIAAALNKAEVTYKALNSPGGIIKAADGKSESMPAAGKFSVPGAQLVSFRVRPGGFPLGDFQVDPTGPPAVSIYFALVPRVARTASPAPEPPSAAPATAGQTATERQQEIETKRAKEIRDKYFKPVDPTKKQ